MHILNLNSVKTTPAIQADDMCETVHPLVKVSVNKPWPRGLLLIGVPIIERSRPGILAVYRAMPAAAMRGILIRQATTGRHLRCCSA